jgi:hypothetical protein
MRSRLDPEHDVDVSDSDALAHESKFSCESVIFFFGLARGAGSETDASSLSSSARMVFARSTTLSGRPASQATWMP